MNKSSVLFKKIVFVITNSTVGNCCEFDLAPTCFSKDNLLQPPKDNPPLHTQTKT